MTQTTDEIFDSEKLMRMPEAFREIFLEGYRKGFQEGFQIGFQIGFQEGMRETRFEFAAGIVNELGKYGVSMDQILNILRNIHIPEDIIHEVSQDYLT